MVEGGVALAPPGVAPPPPPPSVLPPLPLNAPPETRRPRGWASKSQEGPLVLPALPSPPHAEREVYTAGPQGEQGSVGPSGRPPSSHRRPNSGRAVSAGRPPQTPPEKRMEARLAGAQQQKMGGGGQRGGVLEEELEPATEEEIGSMADHLGMDAKKDFELLWIAAEAYDAPLPEGWSEHFDWDGKVYFYNRVEDVVVRDHPLDDFYRELYKIYKSKGASVSDSEARAHAAAQAAALAQSNMYGQKPRQTQRRESATASEGGGGSGAPPGAASHVKSTTTGDGGAQSMERRSSTPGTRERQFVETTMGFMQNLVETMNRSQMQNTQMQAQMQSELIKQIQASSQVSRPEEAHRLLQQEVLAKLEAKLNHLQDVQYKELAHIKSLEENQKTELDRLVQASSTAAAHAAEVAARADSSSAGVAAELLAQKEAIEGHRAELEARIAALREEHTVKVEGARAEAAGQVAAAQGELQNMLTTLEEAGNDLVDPDVLEVMSTATSAASPLQPSTNPAAAQAASSTATAIALLREKLSHAEKAAAEANDGAMQEKLARINTDMEEKLRGRIRELEAEQEVRVRGLHDRLERAERDAQAAREEVRWEKEKAEKMLQSAMQIAADAGSKASAEQSARLMELQQALNEKEKLALEAQAALRSEREKLSSQEATTARIEEMLQDMKDGATSLDDRLAHFEALLAAKEAEKRELLETTGQLRGELAAAKSSANDVAQAAQQSAMVQVAQLNAQLEAERARGEMALRLQEAEHAQKMAAEASSGRMSGDSLHKLQKLAGEVVGMRAAHREAKDLQRNFTLYAFNKITEAQAALQEMAAHAQREKYLRERLDTAVRECDTRMEPLVAEKRRLFNELLRAKGNIRVFCRVRPFSTKEAADGVQEAFAFPDGGGSSRTGGEDSGGRLINTLALPPAVPNKQYEFDRVFGPETGQEDTYAAVRPLIQSVMDGFNVCVFAYGQTGSGKTFTMEGPPDDRGVTYRAFEELFRMAKEVWGAYEYTFHVNLLEIYNENVRDLLVKKGAVQEAHGIKTDEEGNVTIANIVEETVSTPEEFVALMRRGSGNRATGATAMNDRSSRSHLIMSIRVVCRNLVSGVTVRSKLSLVDLAGSERVGKTGAEGERLKESMFINKSLSALGDVISALTARKAHIPFRNSKLTHILSDSLGNDSKTLLFVACSPAQYNAHESSCSLNFAQRARNVDLSQGGGGTAAKRWKEAAATQAKEAAAQIRALEEECDRLKDAAEAARSGGEEKGKKAKSREADEARELRAELKELKRTNAAAQAAAETATRELERRDSTIKGLQSNAAMLEQQLAEQKRATAKSSAAASSAAQQQAARPNSEQAQRITMLEEKLAKREAELADAKAQLSSRPRSRRASTPTLGSSRPSSSGNSTPTKAAAAKEAAAEAARGAPPPSEAEMGRIRTQLAALTDINKALLEKCKTIKAERGSAEKALAERDAAFKLLEAKYRLLVKKFAPTPTNGSKPSSPGILPP